jgi:pimeloyl-ACP methyl ester carboxylesterase
MNLFSQLLLGTAPGAGAQGCAPAAAVPATTTQTRFLAVGDGQIAYDDTGGSGPLVLAIPGMGDLRSEYRALRPLLQQAGYRVVTVDIRGHGESSVRWSDYSAHAVGRDALALIEHLDAGPAVILGNSFAAGSALWAAHDAPKWVRGVVLLGPIVRDGPPSWFGTTAVAVGFGGPWRVAFWTTYWNSLFPSRKPADHAAARAALASNLREPGRMDALRTMIGLSKADTGAMLARSRVPALVVMGTDLAERQALVGDVAQGQLAPYFVHQVGESCPLIVEPALQASLAQVQALRRRVECHRPVGHALGQLAPHTGSHPLLRRPLGQEQVLCMGGDDARKAGVGGQHRTVQKLGAQYQAGHPRAEPWGDTEDRFESLGIARTRMREFDRQSVHGLSAQLRGHHDERGQCELGSVPARPATAAVEPVLYADCVAIGHHVEARQIVHQPVVASQALQRRPKVGGGAHGIVQHVESTGADRGCRVHAEQRVSGQFRRAIPQALLHRQRNTRLGIA